ncbi:hypothetical protein A1O3_01451 [Capronia epimyces CBS 606.96]|uniref:Xylanolytic transcriptional activator regulatory domain-containing protein n=1 Tax=Capronia epimyces CBS 606.96 TaxID=1182542 RepID=W9YJ50_9EURO|nr:uncharacterized protein A1O3_01451 [Capronia epimyces CBS 606.96]EXJ92897.1 hypothetical protein A1O3_01451 [Capronia epimyces CBS 606.96]
MAWRRPIGPRSRVRSTSGRLEAHSRQARSVHSVVDEDQSSGKSQEAIEDEDDVSASQTLARTSLAQFFQRGVPSAHWEVFHTLDRMRTAYIGTHVANLSHLINLDQSSRHFLLYPHPEIHPSPPSLPPALDPSGHGQGQGQGLSSKLRGIAAFLSKEIRDDLVESFFSKINPIFPVVDEAQFRSRYHESQAPPPLLLLQAILMAGAHVSQHKKVAESRSMIKSLLFRQGKWLFDTRHENDRQHLVQAALLFTWHVENADTVSMNGHFWSGVACRIAFGMAMHRNILSDPPERMPFANRRLYRRVWWTLFQVEVLSALEHGRPSMIRLEDFDQPLLELQDFQEADGVVNSRLNFQYSVKNIELCFIVLDILKLTSPGFVRPDTPIGLDSFHSRLAAWAMDLPRDADCEFWSLHLQLHYHCVVLHLFRLPNGQCASPLTPLPLDWVELCNGAGRAILAIFETMMATKVMDRCSSTSVMALTASAIQLSKEIQHSLRQRSTLVALNLIRDLERLFPIATALSESWPNAEGVLRLFSHLVENFKALVETQHHSPPRRESFNIDALQDLNWEEILRYPSPYQLDEADIWLDSWTNPET